MSKRFSSQISRALPESLCADLQASLEKIFGCALHQGNSCATLNASVFAKHECSVKVFNSSVENYVEKTC